MDIGDPKLEAMLNEHDVNMFVSGHHHAYYPGKRGQLLLLSTPCLGAAARPLIGTEDRGAKGLVSLIIFEDDDMSIEGFDANQNLQGINYKYNFHKNYLFRLGGYASFSDNNDIVSNSIYIATVGLVLLGFGLVCQIQDHRSHHGSV